MKLIRTLLVCWLTALPILAVAPAVSSCSAEQAAKTPDEAEALNRLLEQEKSLTERLEAAKADGDLALAAALEGELEFIQGQLADLEAELMRKNAGPVVGILSTIHPLLGAFSPLLLGFAPLLGKRGRRLAKSGVKNLTTGQITEAVLDLGKYIGIKDSRPDPTVTDTGTNP